MPEITPAQIKRIHTLKNALEMTDTQYRAALEQFHVFSSKQLTEAQAGQFASELENVAVSKGKWVRPYRKYQHLGGRRDMATPKQLRMIEAMWGDVSRAGTNADRAAALKKFLQRFDISTMEDIRWYDVRKIVAALKAMQAGVKGEI
ncbi:MAG: regulatory protein GemA [Elusimicrobia bacterium]|nr:regulatory protein GemA [Elusimicrobiota bacterium]